MVRKAGLKRKIGAARHAFSLLELMLVVAIMGVLMAVVAYNVLGAGDRAKLQATKATLKTIQTALSDYHLNQSSYPPDLQTLVTAKFLADMKMVDGWATPIMYSPNSVIAGQGFSLGSAGPDKVAGNEDDIDVWTMNR